MLRLLLRRVNWTPYLLVLPAGLLVGMFLYWPILGTVQAAVEVEQAGKVVRLGLDNFRAIFADRVFLRVLWQTVAWTSGVVFPAVVIALAIALVLHRRLPLRSVMRALVILPWATPMPIGAMIWKWILHGRLGLLNEALMRLGIIAEPVQWLATADSAFPMIILAGIWMTVSFPAIALLSGLQSIPSEYYEAAELDGATKWQQFWDITLPSLMPVLSTVTLLEFIMVFNSFPVVWILTQGGPNSRTDLLVTYLYTTAFKYLEFGKASAMSVVGLAIILAYALLFLRLTRRREAT